MPNQSGLKTSSFGRVLVRQIDNFSWLLVSYQLASQVSYFWLFNVHSLGLFYVKVWPQNILVVVKTFKSLCTFAHITTNKLCHTMIPDFFRSRKQIRCWLFSKLGAQEMHRYVTRNQGCQQRKLQRNKEDSSFLSRFSPKTQSWWSWRLPGWFCHYCWCLGWTSLFIRLK